MSTNNNQRYLDHRIETVPTTRHLPEFLRLPKVPEHCQYTGLSRATLNQLILGPEAPVKSVVLRKRGKIRGIRLIVTASLLEYLHSDASHGSPRTSTVKNAKSYEQ